MLLLLLAMLLVLLLLNVVPHPAPSPLLALTDWSRQPLARLLMPPTHSKLSPIVSDTHSGVALLVDAARRRRVVFNRRYNGADGGGKHKFLEWPLRHCVVVVVVALTPNHICGVRQWSRRLT